MEVSNLIAVVLGKVNQLAKKVALLESQLSSVNHIALLKTETPVLEVGGEYKESLPLDGDANSILMKAIHVAGDMESAIDLEIYSGLGEDSFLIYKNAVQSNVLYDVVDLPYIDEDETGKLHLVVSNKGSVATKFTVRITGLTTK